jgi:hypothetical protein
LPFLFVVFRVGVRVVFRGLVPMMGRVQFVRMRHVGVMAGLLVITAFVMFGRFTVMMRSGLVMLGCEFVVVATLSIFALMSLSLRSGNCRRSDCDRNLTGV